MEVFLSKEITNENGYVDEVVSSVKSAPVDEELVMLITCIGGDTFQGERINRAIIEHPNKTRAVVIGLAASMASSLLSAFDKVEFDPDSELMFHKARITNDSGKVLDEYTPEQEQRISNFNQKIYERFLKMGADKEFLHQVFLSDSSENFWLSAEEAENMKFGNVVPVERNNVERLTNEAFNLAAKLDISEIKETLNKNMGLFKNKKVLRVHNLLDGKQVAVTSSKEEIQKGDILSLVGSNDSLKGTLKLSDNLVAEVDEENKVTNIEEVANEVSDEEKSEIMTRLEDLEKMVRELMPSKEDEEAEMETEAKTEAKEKELEDKLEAVNKLSTVVLEAAATISTSAKLDTPENKGKKEEINLTASQQHLVNLQEATKLKVQ